MSTSRRWLASLACAALLAGCGGPAAAPPALADPPAPSADEGLSSTVAPPAPSASVPAGGACHGFPADNIWRADVSKLPVHRSSAAYIASIGADRTMHPDFGAGLWEGAPIGIPITVVGTGQAKVKVSFEYAGESDRVAYPIPAN